jgi:hypothetical protein
MHPLALSLTVSLAVLAALVAALLLPACGKSDPAPASGAGGPEPAHVRIDHILIGVNSEDFPQGRYSQEEARDLAYEIAEKLKAGADWDALKRQHSEDPPPGGPYDLANRGVTPLHPREFRREGMVAAFGDVGFRLAVGEVGVADYDPQRSKFGFHVIKRVK